MGNIQKNQEASLNDIIANLRQIIVGFNWEAPAEIERSPVDIDASVFLLSKDGKVRFDTDFVFYNNQETENGSVIHLGECKTPEGRGDNERIQIVLDGLGFDVDKIVFAITIHNSRDRSQNFSIVKNAFMRIIDIDNNVEMIRLDLEDQIDDCDGLIFGELYRDLSGWKFRALNKGIKGGLYIVANEYGVNVAPN